MKTKTEQEINAEKAAKPRPDLIPATAIYEEGRAFGVGAAKHGLGPTGRGTYRVAGTQQATVACHFASLMRHINAWHRGEDVDPESGDDKLLHLGCARAQLAIMIDLIQDPPVEAVAEPEPAANDDPWALPEGWGWEWEWEPDGRVWVARHPRFRVCPWMKPDVIDPDNVPILRLVWRRNAEDPR